MTDHKSLTEALVAFQAELPDVSKGGTNPAFKSKYATLPDVTKAVFPVLTKHGLAWVCIPDVTVDGPVMRWELRHVSGETLAGVWPLPDAVKAQELGSWHTYGRRYCLSAVTGITPDEDDDGNGATSPARVRREPSSDSIAKAVIAIDNAADAAALDKLEELTVTRGINGVAPVKAALVAKRAELGKSDTDHWAVKDVAP